MLEGAEENEMVGFSLECYFGISIVHRHPVFGSVPLGQTLEYISPLPMNMQYMRKYLPVWGYTASHLPRYVCSHHQTPRRGTRSIATAVQEDWREVFNLIGRPLMNLVQRVLIRTLDQMLKIRWRHFLIGPRPTSFPAICRFRKACESYVRA